MADVRPPTITIREMRVDEVDGGLPRLTLTPMETGEARTYALAPDAVRGLVDALLGVAEPPPGECRIVVRCDALTLAKAIQATKENPDVR